MLSSAPAMTVIKGEEMELVEINDHSGTATDKKLCFNIQWDKGNVKLHLFILNK